MFTVQHDTLLSDFNEEESQSQMEENDKSNNNPVDLDYRLEEVFERDLYHQNMKDNDMLNLNEERHITTQVTSECTKEKASSTTTDLASPSLTQSQSQNTAQMQKPFFIMTQRKLKPDSIYKKSMSSFFKSTIAKLNAMTKLSFHNISVDTKKMKLSVLKANMNKTLAEFLINETESRKYKKGNKTMNKENIQVILESPKFSSAFEFINKTLKEIYFEFLLSPQKMKGPSYYIEYYKERQKDLLFDDRIKYNQIEAKDLTKLKRFKTEYK